MDQQFTGFLRKDITRQIVAKGILLPVQKVVVRLHFHGISFDGSAAMGRGSQSHHMRMQGDGLIKSILGDVIDGDANRHDDWLLITNRELVGNRSHGAVSIRDDANHGAAGYATGS